MNYFSELAQQISEYYSKHSVWSTYRMKGNLLFWSAMAGSICGLVIYWIFQNIAALFVVAIVLCLVIYIYLKQKFRSPITQTEINVTIQNIYKLRICKSSKKEIWMFNLAEDIETNSKLITDNTAYYDYNGLDVTSLSENGDTYKAYIIKQPDDTWALCSLDNTGTYTPLPTDGTAYQTLKERSKK